MSWRAFGFEGAPPVFWGVKVIAEPRWSGCRTMAPYSILVVDDEKLLRNRIRDMLQDLPLNIVVVGEAKNGVEALCLVNDLRPDILVTDIKMPVMDGLELIVKASEARPELQMVVISGFAEFEYAHHALKYHVHHYLLKPIDPGELEYSIAEVCTDLAPATTDEPAMSRTVSAVDLAPIERLVRFVDTHYGEDLSLVALSAQFHYNARYLSGLFKRYTGRTYVNYLTTLRMSKAMNLLAHTAHPVGVIASEIGYSDPQYFHRVFKRHVRMTPGEYRGRC